MKFGKHMTLLSYLKIQASRFEQFLNQSIIYLTVKFVVELITSDLIIDFLVIILNKVLKKRFILVFSNRNRLECTLLVNKLNFAWSFDLIFIEGQQREKTTNTTRNSGSTFPALLR